MQRQDLAMRFACVFVGESVDFSLCALSLNSLTKGG